MFEKLMKFKILALLSLILGLTTSLITGLIPHPTTSIIGMQKWGYPLYWLSKAISPDAILNIIWAFLLFDILLWILLFFMLIKMVDLILRRFKKKNKKNI